jgi:hypothetical protein
MIYGVMYKNQFMDHKTKKIYRTALQMFFE